MVTEYGLGEHVAMTHAISREKGGEARTWKPYKFKQRGVITGVRTLSNGHVQSVFYDEPVIYIPAEYFTAYLVAWDIRQKPVFALPEHLEGVGISDRSSTSER